MIKNLLLIFIPLFLFSQNVLENGFKSASLNIGYSHLSVVDDYLSDENYSGYLNDFSLKWYEWNKNRSSKIVFNYRSSEEIRNQNINSNIIIFLLTYNKLYEISIGNLLTKEYSLFLGPSIGTYFYLRELDIAKKSNLVYSVFGLFSTSIESKFSLKISDNLFFNNFLNLNIIAFSFKSISLGVDKKQSISKLLYPFSYFQTHSISEIQYFIMKNSFFKFHKEINNHAA